MSLKVESKIGKSGCIDEDLFDFLSDFTKFVKLLPPQYQSNIEATTNECSISAGVMGQFSLKHLELERPKLIKIGTDSGKESLTIWVQLKKMDAYDTRIKITISLETNFMTKMMIKGKIQQFADSLVDAISQIPPQLIRQI